MGSFEASRARFYTIIFTQRIFWRIAFCPIENFKCFYQLAKLRYRSCWWRRNWEFKSAKAACKHVGEIDHKMLILVFNYINNFVVKTNRELSTLFMATEKLLLNASWTIIWSNTAWCVWHTTGLATTQGSGDIYILDSSYLSWVCYPLDPEPILPNFFSL